MSLYENEIDPSESGDGSPLHRADPGTRGWHRSKARRDAAIHPFLAAHTALAGAASGGVFAHVRVSSRPSDWRYSAEIITAEKFKGTQLAKATVKIEACISWLWAEPNISEPWEHACPRENVVPLGARQLKRPVGISEASWLVYGLHKPGSIFQIDSHSRLITVNRPILVLQHYLALKLGPVCILKLTHPSPSHFEPGAADAALTEAVRQQVTQRLEAPNSVAAWAEALLTRHL